MEDKTYGVKTHLVEEFKRFQIGIRDRQLKMPPFVGDADLLINGASMRCRIEALNGVLSITPFPLLPQGLISFKLPPQNFNNVSVQGVQIVLHPAMNVVLFFPSENEKDEFVAKMGELNSQGSSSSNSASSPSISGSNLSVG